MAKPLPAPGARDPGKADDAPAGSANPAVPQKHSKEADSPAPAFTIEQRVIPGLLGIAIEKVRELRGRVCQENADWRADGSRILWTEGGVAKLKAALALPASAPEPETTAGAPAKKLRVWRTAPAIRNQRLVEVVWDEGKTREPMRMYVRDNTQWKVGVRVGLEAVRELGPGLYEYLGGKAPQK